MTKGIYRVRQAFTLIELIITMVILSIVAYFASDLIAKTYLGYNRVNNLQRANLRVEIALNSITNRLEYAIPGTIVKRKSATDSALASIESAPNNYTVLEWVGNDIDGFEAHANLSGTGTTTIDKPAWSGFCNIAKSEKTKVVTPGSNLSYAEEIIQRLSDDKVSFQNGLVALFFPGNYDYRSIGYNGSTISGIALVSRYNQLGSYFSLLKPINRITEHYKLAWSAYAVLPVNCNSKGVCDLELRYNFRPWRGEDYDSATTSSALLAKNVTVFKTYATENRVHIKLCIQERIGATSNTSICKEKVVYR